MQRRESSLYLKPFHSFDTSTSPSSTLSDESSNRKRSISSSIAKLPEWLLDYDHGSNETKLESYRVRPLTENSGLQRPLWFQELLQPRRYSEVLLPSSFEAEEDMAYRFGIMDMDREDSDQEKSQSDVDIIMILDEDFTEHRVTRKNGSKSRKQRNLSKFFDSHEFNFNSEPGSQRSTEDPDKEDEDSLEQTKCDDLMLTLDAKNLPENGGNMFRRKYPLERDSRTAKDIDLESLDEPEPSDFIIPELPEGRELCIEIKSNWGDEDFVGLNGIEIFDLKTKSQPLIEKIFCETNPKSDAKKLIDGVYRSHDDDHIWMTEYQPFTVCRIRIRFQEKISIVLLRIWNYNKSRIYSYRGVRYVIMSLDGNVIFRGEIAKAFGELTGLPEKFGDTILFTTDEAILESVAANDVSFQELLTQNT